jgi:iron(III) transport system permease protein
LTLILRPFNFETLATNSYRFASEEMLVYSAVPSFFLILLSVFAVYYLNKFLYKKV